MVCSQCVRTYRPKSCIIQIHGITTPHPIRSTTCVFKNLSIKILILRVFVAQMATHVASWEDEDGWTHGTCPENHNFPNMLCRLSRDLGKATEHIDRKSTRLNSSHTVISYAVFCLKKKINSNL